MRSRKTPNCPVCGKEGSIRYYQLCDVLFGVPGQWDIRFCPVNTCGVMWCDPMPIPEDISLAYKDYYTHRQPDSMQKKKILIQTKLSELMRNGFWASQYGYIHNKKSLGGWLLGIIALVSPVYRSYMDGDVMFLESVPGGKVLDLGCGDGTRLRRLTELGWEGVGVDVDSNAVKSAISQGVNAYCGNLNELDFADNFFDAIVLRHVIEHIHNPLAILKECKRLLKPGGQFVITTPNTRSLGHRYYANFWRGIEVPRHLTIYTCSSIKNLVMDSGLSVTQCKSFHGYPILKESYDIATEVPMTGSNQSIKRNKFVSAFLLSICESLLLHLGFDVGEQIVLTANKLQGS